MKKLKIISLCIVLVLMFSSLIPLSMHFQDNKNFLENKQIKSLSNKNVQYFYNSSKNSNFSYPLNYSLYLGNVNSSYNSFILVPVMLNDYHSFSNIVQLVSFNFNVLKFNGVLNDLSSQSVIFNFTNVSQGMVRITGNGTFTFPFNPTVLYYLNFSSLVRYDFRTNITIDYTYLSSAYDPFQYSATVELTRGWTNLGPTNISGYMAGTVPAVGYSPYNLSILYAASGRGGPWQGNIYQGESVSGFGGMFRSVDFGKSWISINNGLNSTDVNTIAVDPYNPDIVVIATGGIASMVGGGIFKTVNGGRSWQETYPVGGNFITYYHGYLYAASYHAILRSSDFGTTWTVLSYFPGIVTTMALTDNGSRIFVGIYQYNYVSILMSNDGGRNYVDVQNFQGYFTVSQIIIDPDNSSQMWALIAHGYTIYPNLFNSYDGGLTWNAVNDTAVNITYAIFYGSSFQNGYVAEVPQAIAYDPDNGSIIYVVGPGYVYKSYNGGRHFIGLASGMESGYELFSGIAGQDNRMINIDPLNDSIVFKGSDQGLAVSFDGGYDWKPLNNRSASLVYTVAADGNNIFTIDQDFTPIFSNDSGKTWYTAPGNEEGWASVDPYNSSIVLVESSDLEVSDNGGNTFFVPYISNISAFGITSKNVIGFAYSDNKNKTIFAAEMGGVFESNDSGKSWTLIQNSPKGIFALAIDPVNQSILYASNFFHTYISRDKGLNWSILNNESFNSISVDPENDSIVAGAMYIGDYISYPAISLDHGKNFIVLKNMSYEFVGAVHSGLTYGLFNKSSFLNISSVNFFGASPQVFFHNAWNGTWLFYTTDNGLFVSYNLGRSWSNLDFNLPNKVISDLFISCNGSAYISTYGGGIFFDPELLNISYNNVLPILTGYSKTGITLNGISYKTNGYFSFEMAYGINNVSFIYNGSTEYLNIFAMPGGTYFINISSSISEITIVVEGMEPGQHIFLSLNNNVYLLSREYSKISLPFGSYNYRAYASNLDYGITSIENGSGIIRAGFMPAEIVFSFHTTVNSSPQLIPNEVVWTNTISVNKYYAVYAGGGIGVINLSTGKEFSGPGINGQFYSSVPDKNGFILVGNAGNGGLVMEFYPQNDTLINITNILPIQWTKNNIVIENVQITDNGSMLFFGSGPNTILFGGISNGKFYNLSRYLINAISPAPWPQMVSMAYIPSSNSVILYGGFGSETNPLCGLEILNLTTFSVEDLTQEIPIGVSIFLPLWVPYGSFIASNNDSALLLENFFGQQGHESLIKNGKITDVSALFPSNIIFLRASWNGRDFVMTGINGTSQSPDQTPVVYLFNPSTLTVTEVYSNYLNNTGFIFGLSSINTTRFILATFNETVSGSYGVIHSRLIIFNVTPSKAVELNIEPDYSNIIINNDPVSQNGFAYYSSFSNSCSIKIIINDYSVLNESISLVNFSTIYLNYSFISSITFMEKGLPSNTTWSVMLDNKTIYSDEKSITFNEYYGNYSFSILPVLEYHTNKTKGQVLAYSNYVNISIIFEKNTYNITFTETGLPSGTSWSVTLNNVTEFSTNNTITFQEPNGTYFYSIETNISGGTGIQYIASQSSGAATVDGFNITVKVSYITQYYLTMLASPANGGSVNPTSGWYSAGSSVTINAIPNSNYDFVSWTGTGNGSHSGILNQTSIIMNGPITEKANFAELYSVTFFETGLPSGTIWFLNLSNGKSYNTTGNSIEIQITNGSYSYTIETTNKDYSSRAGSLIVNGSNLEMNIKFNLVTYSIIFLEQGLSPDTLWSVTLNGNTLNSTTSTITFKESNGTYSYIIGYINGYNVSSISGTITVNGKNVTQAVTFTVNSTKTYNITFTESGLPAGTSWSVTLNGITKTSKNNTIEFSVPYGTYNYTLLLPGGYKTSQSSGTITTAQSNTNVPIVISSTNLTSSSQSTTNSNELLWVGAIAVVVLIAIVSGVVFLKRSKNKKPPKQ